MANTKKTTVIKSYLNIRDEKIANAGITPGHLIERMSTDKVKVHATAGGNVNPLFACEDTPQGKGITHAYLATELVQIWKPIPGEQVNAIFDDTSGGTLAIGDFLESNGDGTLRKYIAPLSAAVLPVEGSIVAVALESAVAGGRVICEIV